MVTELQSLIKNDPTRLVVVSLYYRSVVFALCNEDINNKLKISVRIKLNISFCYPVLYYTLFCVLVNTYVTFCYFFLIITVLLIIYTCLLLRQIFISFFFFFFVIIVFLPVVSFMLLAVIKAGLFFVIVSQNSFIHDYYNKLLYLVNSFNISIRTWLL